jgi:hypothetical protein
VTTTQATTEVPRVVRAPLFIESWNGVIQRLQSLYSKQSQITADDIAIVPVANPSALRQMLQSQAKPLQLPVIGVTPTSVDPNENNLNAAVARKHGVSFSMDEDESFWYVLKARPVVLTFQVTMVTDDVVTLLRMVDRWESNETWGFTLVVPDTSVKAVIKVVPDKSLAIPQSAQSPDGSNQFELTTNLKVETLAGFIWRVPTIRAIELTANVPKSSILEAIEDPSRGIEVMTKTLTQFVPST